VLRNVAQGRGNKEIGTDLIISESTVKYHLRNILDKLHLENRGQVIAYATRRGLDATRRPTIDRIQSALTFDDPMPL